MSEGAGAASGRDSGRGDLPFPRGGAHSRPDGSAQSPEVIVCVEEREAQNNHKLTLFFPNREGLTA